MQMMGTYRVSLKKNYPGGLANIFLNISLIQTGSRENKQNKQKRVLD